MRATKQILVCQKEGGRQRGQGSSVPGKESSVAPSPSGMVQEGVQSLLPFESFFSHFGSPGAGGAGRGRSCSLTAPGSLSWAQSVLLTLKLCE